jgi:hypothetical protein
MRLTALPLAAAAILAATVMAGCSDDHSKAGGAATGKATTAAASGDAAACRAYDAALERYSQGIDGRSNVPAVIQNDSGPAMEKISNASQLAAGPTRDAMDESATQIQLLLDKEDGWESAGFDNSAEVAAVKKAIAEVDRLCRQAGAGLKHVPRPA